MALSPRTGCAKLAASRRLSKTSRATQTPQQEPELQLQDATRYKKSGNAEQLCKCNVRIVAKSLNTCRPCLDARSAAYRAKGKRTMAVLNARKEGKYELLCIGNI